MPTITKKWKWASMRPPERCTITAEDITRPRAAIADVKRRRRPSVVARAAKVATMPASVRLWTTP
jgi:hypothetical protein